MYLLVTLLYSIFEEGYETKSNSVAMKFRIPLQVSNCIPFFKMNFWKYLKMIFMKSVLHWWNTL